ncbi:hypothetical protein ACIHEI_30905 [Kitasatospora sp. NPDC051984]|uniref:hypothetical protein n=1 Tax=Kitasatospora sp. NPDC051984 TaxID=3364059 RepID=UPI0037C69FB5
MAAARSDAAAAVTATMACQSASVLPRPEALLCLRPQEGGPGADHPLQQLGVAQVRPLQQAQDAHAGHADVPVGDVVAGLPHQLHQAGLDALAFRQVRPGGVEEARDPAGPVDRPHVALRLGQDRPDAFGQQQRELQTLRGALLRPAPAAGRHLAAQHLVVGRLLVLEVVVEPGQQHVDGGGTGLEHRLAPEADVLFEVAKEHLVPAVTLAVVAVAEGELLRGPVVVEQFP